MHNPLYENEYTTAFSIELDKVVQHTFSTLVRERNCNYMYNVVTICVI